MKYYALKELLTLVVLTTRLVHSAKAGWVKPRNGTYSGSAMVGTKGLVFFEVSISSSSEETRCSLDLLKCHTPANVDCSSHAGSGLYQVKDQGSSDLAWYCAIEIPQMQKKDVGIYYLCKKDMATGNCNNIHPTIFEAWYYGPDNRRCEIKFNETLERGMDNCTLRSTTPTPTTHSVSTMIPTTIFTTENIDPGKTEPEPGGVKTTTDRQHIAPSVNDSIGNQAGFESGANTGENMLGVIMGTILATVIVVLFVELVVYKLWRMMKRPDTDDATYNGVPEEITPMKPTIEEC